MWIVILISQWYKYWWIPKPTVIKNIQGVAVEFWLADTNLLTLLTEAARFQISRWQNRGAISHRILTESAADSVSWTHEFCD